MLVREAAVFGLAIVALVYFLCMTQFGARVLLFSGQMRAVGDVYAMNASLPESLRTTFHFRGLLHILCDRKIDLACALLAFARLVESISPHWMRLSGFHMISNRA